MNSTGAEYSKAHLCQICQVITSNPASRIMIIDCTIYQEVDDCSWEKKVGRKGKGFFQQRLAITTTLPMLYFFISPPFQRPEKPHIFLFKTFVWISWNLLLGMAAGVFIQFVLTSNGSWSSHSNGISPSPHAPGICHLVERDCQRNCLQKP